MANPSGLMFLSCRPIRHGVTIIPPGYLHCTLPGHQADPPNPPDVTSAFTGTTGGTTAIQQINGYELYRQASDRVLGGN
ncbi:hypothetical protein [Paraburkholderia terricola]|uniref:hypothetical protein n=1 Tax=Paraburkholderia terricola TaxID=169427 RepID=UPI0012603038|nr:hypothetical protein [Paraburkholderia terricola]